MEPDIEEVNRNYQKLLRENIAEVTFTKKSTGETRVMRCTLNAQHLPEQTQEQATRAKQFNPEVVSVFDLDKQDWRSFRIDSIVSVAVLESV